MKVTYFALKPLQVGEEWRQVGDLVPEAAAWTTLSIHLREQRLAPVLVATLPVDARKALAEWEKEKNGE